MSERMNKERAIEILKNIIKSNEYEIKKIEERNKKMKWATVIDKHPQERIQALDIAIDSLYEPHYKYLKCDKGVVYVLNEWSDTDSLNCEKCRIEKLKEVKTKKKKIDKNIVKKIKKNREYFDRLEKKYELVETENGCNIIIKNH